MPALNITRDYTTLLYCRLSGRAPLCMSLLTEKKSPATVESVPASRVGPAMAVLATGNVAPPLDAGAAPPAVAASALPFGAPSVSQ